MKRVQKFCYLGDTLGSGWGVEDWCLLAEGWWWRGARGRGRSRKTWEQCVKDDINLVCILSGLFLRGGT